VFGSIAVAFITGGSGGSGGKLGRSPLVRPCGSASSSKVGVRLEAYREGLAPYLGGVGQVST